MLMLCLLDRDVNKALTHVYKSLGDAKNLNSILALVFFYYFLI